MNLFPAVVLGGPPHAGKSVLSYSLSHALRERGVQHYVLRAAPDYEGDWSNEADQETVRTIRMKGPFTPAFVEHVCQSLASRHLPLLVDVGGLPSQEQEVIFDQCTHAILLHKEESDLEAWQALADRHNLITLALLRSTLDSASLMTDSGPILHGIIGGLVRGTQAAGPPVEALAQRLAGLFAYSPEELASMHLLNAPVENVRVVEELAAMLNIPNEGEKYRWEPEHLPRLLEVVPGGQPLAVYGRGPTWLYTALAAHTSPAPFWQFDVRLGWVKSLALHVGEASPDAPLQAERRTQSDHTRLEFRIPRAYLNYEEAADLRIPEVPPAQGLVLSGKLPNWLLTSLVLAYNAVAWVGVYYPQLDGAIVVSRPAEGAPAIGAIV
ncbi:MAG TPA: CRISPR-associated protein Csx3 [Anaerolineae bacterium]|nr:CRISPR-associated protein Csx3 [Anaerolineae bacterium]